MKGIGILCVMCGCTLMGFLVDTIKFKRLTELQQFIRCFELLKGEIHYRLTPIGEACQYVAEKNLGPVGDVFLNFALALRTKESPDSETMWQDSLKGCWEVLHLEQEDFDMLKEFGATLGGVDKTMQQRTIEMMLNKLVEKVASEKARYEKNTKLHKSLGVLVGLCLSIFLI
jgi:stage III sporulation protein AB